MRKGWIIALALFLLIMGVVLGVSIYNKNKTDQINTVQDKKLAEENTATIYTASIEEKVSPNAKILQKVYYTGCDHLLKDTVDVPEQLINKSREDVQNYYKKWTIDSFSPGEITIYKEESGFCDQHYLVKEHNGVLGIYNIDEKGKITLKKDTEIQTKYLTEIDLEKVKSGIEAIGNMELNSVLEDFE